MSRVISYSCKPINNINMNSYAEEYKSREKGKIRRTNNKSRRNSFWGPGAFLKRLKPVMKKKYSLQINRVIAIDPLVAMTLYW
jgi:hypothetical protein